MAATRYAATLGSYTTPWDTIVGIGLGHFRIAAILGSQRQAQESLIEPAPVSRTLCYAAVGSVDSYWFGLK
jgi:hypothetical protein